MSESHKTRTDFAKRFGWQDGDVVLEVSGSNVSAPSDPPKPLESADDVTVPPAPGSDRK